MSDSELSDLHLSEDETIDQSLPILPGLTAPPSRTLALSTSTLFTQGLFTRTLDTQPHKVQFLCSQELYDCVAPSVLVSNTTTTNLWRHYSRNHTYIYNIWKAPKAPSSQLSSSQSSGLPQDFFQPRNTQPLRLLTTTKFRSALLNFVVSNNLALQVVGSESFHQLSKLMNPTLPIISPQSLTRDLHNIFCTHHGALSIELQHHIKHGGRLILTTDTWSARNDSEYSAVTVHWINSKWQQKSHLLDVT
jgi:hypothetical protein